MTPSEFKKARHTLGLSLSQLSAILGTDSRTIRKWEADENLPTARRPNETASRVMQWMLGGFRPPQWPD